MGDQYAPNQQNVRADGSGPAEEGTGGPVGRPEPPEPPEPPEVEPHAAENEVPSGTVQDVLDWVGDDPARAQQALDVERSKPTPRTSLITELEARIG